MRTPIGSVAVVVDGIEAVSKSGSNDWAANHSAGRSNLKADSRRWLLRSVRVKRPCDRSSAREMTN